MTFPTDALGERITELAAHLNAATCHLLELIAEFDEREGWGHEGCQSCAHVQGHHVRHWAHGGATALENLVSLCRHHHRMVHEGGFGVVHRRDGVFRFHRSDGTALEATLPRVVVEGCPQQLLMHANRERGLAISLPVSIFGEPFS